MTNTAIGKKTHCGVLEFSSHDIGIAYMPMWMMHNLCVDDGASVRLRVKRLPSISFVQFQPQTHRFAEAVANPKAALEFALNSFTTLTLKDQLSIEYGMR